MKHAAEIYTDGACRGNPGPGGWGALLRYGDVDKQLYGGEHLTTNNRMELKAVIEALSALSKPCKVTLTSDSTYVLKGIREGYQIGKRGLGTAGKKPVKIRFWKTLMICSNARNRMALGKGHSGHIENELVDQLANRGIDEF